MFDEIVADRDEAAAARLLLGTIIRPQEVRQAYELLPLPLGEYGLNLMTEVGCPFACRYCQDRLIPKRILSLDGGLENIKERLPLRKPIHYCDSVLGGEYKRALAICSKLESLDHSFLLSCDIRMEMLTPELIAALVKAGFVEIRLGLDSADDVVLQENGRPAFTDKFVKRNLSATTCFSIIL